MESKRVPLSQQGLESLYAASRRRYLDQVVPDKVASALENAERSAAEASVGRHREYMPCPEVAYLVATELKKRGYHAEPGMIYVDLSFAPVAAAPAGPP